MSISSLFLYVKGGNDLTNGHLLKGKVLDFGPQVIGSLLMCLGNMKKDFPMVDESETLKYDT